jgi:hypothetical protein
MVINNRGGRLLGCSFSIIVKFVQHHFDARNYMKRHSVPARWQFPGFVSVCRIRIPF